MKKFSHLLILFLSISTLFIACDSDDDVIIEPVSYQLKVLLDESFENQAVEGANVNLINTSTQESYQLVTDSDGFANFYSVNPGSYNITATIQFSNDAYFNFFGTETTEDEVNFNGTAENVLINSTTTNLDIVLKTSKIGDLLFKQIYYSGSDTKDGATFRDLFFEIYNNSNEVIYADGLYFAQAFGKSNTNVESYSLSDGQYDWSQSIGQTKGANSNTDYVYADHVYQIPGSGTENPINPGESIVVAGTAINHKEPLTVDEKVYSVNDPTLTVDLSNADFEVYMQDYLVSVGSSGLTSDIDNPNVPNMNVAHRVNEKELLLNPQGRDSFIIFRADDFSTLDKLPSPQSTTVTSTTKLYVQIPNTIIIDGVETNNTDPSKLYPRRLSTAIDGGYQYTTKGTYSSQAIIRKVHTTFGDRKVLQDTNNSTDDFTVIDIPVPGAW